MIFPSNWTQKPGGRCSQEGRGLYFIRWHHLTVENRKSGRIFVFVRLGITCYVLRSRFLKWARRYSWCLREHSSWIYGIRGILVGPADMRHLRGEAVRKITEQDQIWVSYGPQGWGISVSENPAQDGCVLQAQGWFYIPHGGDPVRGYAEGNFSEVSIWARKQWESERKEYMRAQKTGLGKRPNPLTQWDKRLGSPDESSWRDVRPEKGNRENRNAIFGTAYLEASKRLFLEEHGAEVWEPRGARGPGKHQWFPVGICWGCLSPSWSKTFPRKQISQPQENGGRVTATDFSSGQGTLA